MNPHRDDQRLARQEFDFSRSVRRLLFTALERLILQKFVEARFKTSPWVVDDGLQECLQSLAALLDEIGLETT